MTQLNRRRLIVLTLLIFASAAYWLLPISGDIFVVLESEAESDLWPRLRFEPETPRPGETATAILADTVPWVYVKLLVNDEQEATFLRYAPNPLGGEWFWSFTVPDEPTYELAFYHDCDRGCVEWARMEVNTAVNAHRFPATRTPTKLGVVFANPERDWHGRSGWIVELTYARLADEPYWGIDDLAGRVQTAVSAGHRVLVRVDYDQQQSIPPPENGQALDTYLGYVRRLARDDRLQGVYGYVVGSSFNTLANNAQSPERPVTAEWYARVFNGYDTDPDSGNNVLATIRAENATARVLVGPVQPWATDQDGQQPYRMDVPWLNYMNSLVAAVDESAQRRAAAGTPLAAPDGFAVQAFGRPGSSHLSAQQASREPRLDLPRQEWDGAQAGFGVYRDWLAVVNTFDSTQGVPVYITASNTYQPGSNIPPAQNYPAGWLTSALDVINQEPQVRALCWFVDNLPVDTQWDAFSLTNPQGKMREAAAEFEQLLGGG